MCLSYTHTELASHPDILEVSVVARPHPKWGERPMAFVILNPQYADKWIGRYHEFSKNLKEYARTRLPGFACPEWVEVVPELPVSFERISHASVMTSIHVNVIENVYRENYQDWAPEDSCETLIEETLLRSLGVSFELLILQALDQGSDFFSNWAIYHSVQRQTDRELRFWILWAYVITSAISSCPDVILIYW